MSKHTQKRFTKVLHPNRNLLWAIAVCLISAMALVSYISVTNEQQNIQFVFPDIPAYHAFKDSKNGFTAYYPNSWQVESEANGNAVVFENPIKADESITVSTMALNQETALRRSLKIKSESLIYKDGGITVAMLETGSAPKDATSLVAVIKSPKRIYYIHGNSVQFSSFVNKFTVQ
jgi:hypothetical protein